MSGAGERQVDCDYVVVGSGAGGGTLAARLAEAGATVVLLEAGGDPRELSGGDPNQPGENRARDDYDVPVFHAFASENQAYKWDFFVRHYGSDAQQLRDEKYRKEWEGRAVDGVLYPRAGALGGCTAHNAQILVYPHNADWDHIAELTGDDSWRAEAMRGHFERLEDCRHRPLMRFLRRFGYDPSRHGWRGWLRIEKAVPEEVIGDKRLVLTILESVYKAFKKLNQPVRRIRWLLEGRADPNDWRLVQ